MIHFQNLFTFNLFFNSINSNINSAHAIMELSLIVVVKEKNSEQECLMQKKQDTLMQFIPFQLIQDTQLNTMQ